MKNLFKQFVAAILGWQVRRLRKKNKFVTVGVVGSIGKTSTKLAIAQVLERHFKVRYQEGNYNDLVSVPLIFFDEPLPNLFNPLSWLKVFLRNEKQLRRSYDYQVVVVELGTDAPGQIVAFKKYLQLDYAIVTAITPEHMEYFGNIEAVAAEELSVQDFANKIIYNTDFLAKEHKVLLPAGAVSYAIKDTAADFHLANIFHSAMGLEADVKHDGTILLHFGHEVVSHTQLYSVLAAIVMAHQLNMKTPEIIEAIGGIRPVSGRLRRLRGINNSIIIDDTYNASPAAVEAGLETLYEVKAPQKIAILGNMNELGDMSAEAHTKIGEFCDPKQLDLVITLGPDANAYLAPAAEVKGCRVMKFDTPYAAGEYLQSQVKAEAVIFAKGSQNRVFAEETVKMLLADPEDAVKLVRQSDYWLSRKRKAFDG